MLLTNDNFIQICLSVSVCLYKILYKIIYGNATAYLNINI